MRPLLFIVVPVLMLLCASCKSHYGLQTAEALISPPPSTQETVKQLAVSHPHYKISIHNTQYPYDYTSLTITSDKTRKKTPISGTLSIQDTRDGHWAYFSSVWKLSEVNGAEQKEAANHLAKEIFTSLQQRWQLSRIRYKHYNLCN